MKRTCHCGEDGDALVFGPCRKCSPTPESAHAANIAAELNRLERPNLTAAIRDHAARVLPSQYDGDPLDWTELRPYERTLSDGDGDLG